MAPRSFLPLALPRGGELGHGASWRRLRRLAAGVRVHLGVEHEDVDVAPRRQHVVEPAEADVVGPAVAADDPHALARQAAGERQQVAGRGAAAPSVVDQRLRARRAARRPARAGRGCRPRTPGRRDRIESTRSAPTGVGELFEQRGRRVPSGPRGRGAGRARTRRCPRTASCSTPGRGPSALTVHGVVGRLPP